MVEKFDIPIVLIFFKRTEKTLRILEQIARVKPNKLYLISDGPRNDIEKEIVLNTRRQVELGINWTCDVIKNYADINKGVYDRIGKGAQWVFSKEESAIFLEDDNLPDTSFFYYCRDLLEKYKSEEKVFWICGTNYLENYQHAYNYSYMFTKHLMPCGWASWSSKFLKYYDGDFTTYNKTNRKELGKKYTNKSLYKQQRRSLDIELIKYQLDGKPSSWDFQMAYSIRINDLFGISPKVNLIENIGVDSLSTHGGNSMEKVMTARFCGIKTSALEFPLIHPKSIEIDNTYEKKVGNIILYPIGMRMKLSFKTFASNLIRRVFRIKKTDSISKVIKAKISQIRNRK